MACRALWNTTSDESFHSNYYLKLNSCIQLKNQKIKMLNVFSVMENSPKMTEEKFGLSVLAILCKRSWTVPQQRTLSTSVSFINRIEGEMVFA